MVSGGRYEPDPAQPGLDDAPVTIIESGKLAALTSDTEQTRVRPSRANVTAHQRVVDDAHRNGPVLPVRFGTLVPDAETVARDLLDANAGKLLDLLRRVDGRDEYRIRATYRQDVVLREIVAGSAPIRKARARMQGRGGAAFRDDMIDLGEMVRSELERRRQVEAAAILDAVEPHAESWERLAERSDEVAVHAALLVRADRAPALEAAVGRIAEAEAGRLDVELIGPLPPWDFTEGMTA